MTPLETVLSRLPDAKQSGSGWSVQCPAHDDGRASLSVSEGDDGRALIHCHAGCKTEDVCKAMGLTIADLMPPKNEPPKKKKERGKIVKTYDYLDESGKLLFQAVRLEPKDFRQRKPKAGGGWEWTVKGVRLVPYRLPDLVAPENADATIFIFEGEKDVETANRFGLLATCNPMGAGKWKDEYSKLISSREVVLFGDNDGPGREHVRKACRSLMRCGCTVTICYAPVGKDLTEWVESGATLEDVRKLVEAAEPVKEIPAGDDEEDEATEKRQTVVITTDENTVNNQVVKFLGSDTEIYQRGGRLVRVIHANGNDGILRDAEQPRIADLPLPSLREIISRNVNFVIENDDGDQTSRHTPEWCVKGVFYRGNWNGVRHIAGVVTSPILRQDGSILSTPGYDPLTGLVLACRGDEYPIIHKPTLQDAQQAASLLCDVVCDFPFSTPTHRSSWLALLLTILARHAFRGPSPLFLVDANTRGTGKSLLVDGISLIVHGKDAPRMPNPDSDEETRKRITSVAMSGDQFVLIDNVSGSFGCASFDAALTSTLWRDRVLGSSAMIELPLYTVWVATGNNFQLQADTSRRVVHIRMDSPMENPESREDFRHQNLKEFILENRPKLLAAGLTILAGYFSAGRPRQKLPAWGSFEGWSSVIRESLVWCGQADPLAGRAEMVRHADREYVAMRAIFENWDDIDQDCSGVTAGEILGRLERNQGCYGAFREAILELCPPRGGRDLPDVRQLGNKFRVILGRVVNGKRMENRPGRSRQMLWKVANVQSAPSVGESSESSESLNLSNGKIINDECSHTGTYGSSRTTDCLNQTHQTRQTHQAEFLEVGDA